MSFIVLPLETVTRVLQYLGPEDLKKTQVCRYLREIITADLYLQYILELDRSGYTAPHLIRKDLDYGDMIQTLRNQRNRWRQMELGEPKPIEVPNAIRALLHGSCLSDDIYALCYEVMHSDGVIKSSIWLYQLPSFNKGTEFRHWIHDDVGFPVSALTIQAELDLMVLLENYPLDGPNLDQYPHERYRIHLKTISTNEPHPLATLSTPVLELGQLQRLALSDPNPMTLYGRILILRFTPSVFRQAFRPLIVLFDWIAGVQVGRIRLDSYAGCSIAFLSEEYFVIPQGYKHMDASSAHHNQTGALQVYYLPPCTQALEERQARHIATLEFPRLCEPQTELRLSLYGGTPPLPDTPFWATRAKSVPKVYELNRWNHLCLHYEAFKNDEAPRGSGNSQWRFGKDLGTCGLLYISSMLILTLLDQRVDVGQISKPVLIPWEAWGNHVVCLTRTAADVPSACMWGRKSAFIHYHPIVHPNHNHGYHAQLTIFDFSRAARPTQESMGGDKQLDTCTIDVGRFVEPYGFNVDMRYQRITIDLQNDKHQNLTTYGLEINNEHFVAAVQGPSGTTYQQFFYIYTI